MNQSLTQQRLRIHFGEFGAMRYVGHLDLAKTWERILRRARVPLEYTQGFNPRPRVQFAAALAVGVTSESEYLDIWLTERLEDDFPAGWIARLQDASPAGITVYALDEVPIKAPALPTLVTHATYAITLIDTAITHADLTARVTTLLAQDTLERQGHKKTYDLRPLILGLSFDEEDTLIAQLKTGDQGNARPDELLDALGLSMLQARVHRQQLHLTGGE